MLGFGTCTHLNRFCIFRYYILLLAYGIYPFLPQALRAQGICVFRKRLEGHARILAGGVTRDGVLH